MDAEPYKPHPNLSPEINDKIAQSEIEGGADLTKMKVGETLRVTTMSRTYTVTKVRDSDPMYLISGHPKYCPEPTRCIITGSTFGGSMLRTGYLGRGMHMEFFPAYPSDLDGELVTTSMIKEVEELP